MCEGHPDCRHPHPKEEHHVTTLIQRITSLGITCALCHSTVDDSFAPGIGTRLDGWPNRDLDVGAIVNLSPDVSPFAALLQVPESTVRQVFASWGPGQTTPLRGLFARQKGGFYHDGRFPTMLDVVDRYDGVLGLALTRDEKRDLVEYLKSL